VALAARLDRTREVPAETRRRALLERIRAFIERSLGDPHLSPASIAAAHFISLRTLHKLFETQQTTVADWIRRRRLERCAQDLLDPCSFRSRSLGAFADMTEPPFVSRRIHASSCSLVQSHAPWRS
jgi:AraC-like DNA-binding protein